MVRCFNVSWLNSAGPPIGPVENVLTWTFLCGLGWSGSGLVVVKRRLVVAFRVVVDLVEWGFVRDFVVVVALVRCVRFEARSIWGWGWVGGWG